MSSAIGAWRLRNSQTGSMPSINESLMTNSVNDSYACVCRVQSRMAESGNFELLGNKDGFLLKEVNF